MAVVNNSIKSTTHAKKHESRHKNTNVQAANTKANSGVATPQVNDSLSASADSQKIQPKRVFKIGVKE